MTIRQIDNIAMLRIELDRARANGKSIGFVPTMGFLHEGHASLMRAAAADNDLVVASIFVNPLQFGADEDLSTYPRDLPRDTELAAEAGVDLLFTPDVDEMYPFGPVLTSVSIDALSNMLEGATRPDHFAGMATVVTKLFSIVGACRAYFGQKDYQQLAIVRRFVADLSIPVDVVGCPIIRAEDGLALSSRNTYLQPDERVAATVLNRALLAGAALISSGQQNPTIVANAMTKLVDAEPLATLDYAAVVDADTLAVPELISEPWRLLVAAQVGKPRLIDNIGVAS
ncbi:MAG: pantoate--beta-alanine ligase [Acidimicrobiales bacterium]|jgi:pantoate--beta-alanine ligase